MNEYVYITITFSQSATVALSHLGNAIIFLGVTIFCGLIISATLKVVRK